MLESLAASLEGLGATSPLAYLLAFAGGVLAGFGPCVLPMAPVLYAYIVGRGPSATADAEVANARQGARASVSGLLLAFVFVLGMAVVYAAIGTFAGALGAVLLTADWGYYVIAAFCVLVGLHMLGVIHLPFDRFGLDARRSSRRGLLATFALGMAFGLAASPCATPVLAAVSILAAAAASPAVGASLLFAYGLGKGVPLLAVGATAGALSGLAGAGKAAERLTRLTGVALLAGAAYFIWIA